MEPLPMHRHDPLSEEYTLTCQHEGCGAVRIIRHFASAGLKVGDYVPSSSSDPDFGRCLRCKRHTLKITAGPPPPAPLKPVGFTKVPTR